MSASISSMLAQALAILIVIASWVLIIWLQWRRPSRKCVDATKCWKCGYNLAGLADSAYCPECNTDPKPGSPEQLRASRQLPAWFYITTVSTAIAGFGANMYWEYPNHTPRNAIISGTLWLVFIVAATVIAKRRTPWQSLIFRAPIVAFEIAVCLFERSSDPFASWGFMKFVMLGPYAIWTAVMIVIFDRNKTKAPNTRSGRVL